MGDTKEVGDASSFSRRFELNGVLGKGSTSTVRRCREKCTQAEFAVKIVDVSTEKRNQQQANVMRQATLDEISMFRQLAAHPQIVTLHAWFETSTNFFLVFEMARGGELADYLANVLTVSEKKARTIMKQVLLAVEEMHSKRIVHRDLKMENILTMTDQAEVVKITDFGLAAQLKPGERLHELCGTPGYLAPEIIRIAYEKQVKGYGLEVDMWACGVILYTLLCGHAPFFHTRQVIMLRHILEGRYHFRSPEWIEIGNTAKDLIRKLLEIDPKKRLTATEAQRHPFIAQPELKHMQVEKYLWQRSTKAEIQQLKNTFRLAAWKKKLLARLLCLRSQATRLPFAASVRDPYSVRKVRHLIDAVAFRVYGHWVHRQRLQQRDALFADSCKISTSRILAPVAHLCTSMVSHQIYF